MNKAIHNKTIEKNYSSKAVFNIYSHHNFKRCSSSAALQFKDTIRTEPSSDGELVNAFLSNSFMNKSIHKNTDKDKYLLLPFSIFIRIIILKGVQVSAALQFKDTIRTEPSSDGELVNAFLSNSFMNKAIHKNTDKEKYLLLLFSIFIRIII